MTGGEPRAERPKRLRWLLLVLAALLLLALVWFLYTSDAEIVALRNVLHYRVVKRLGGVQVGTGETPGSIAGTVRDPAGEPVAGAVVLVSSPLGHTYVAESDAGGRYRIAGVPAGCRCPVRCFR